MFTLSLHLANDVYYSFVRYLVAWWQNLRKARSKALADGLDTVYVAEFGRDYWEEKNGILTADDLLHIALNRYAGNNKQKLITILYVTRRPRPCSAP